MERHYNPSEVVQDYGNMHMFFEEIIGCMESKSSEYVRAVLEDPYPGYDVGRKITGHLFPESIISGYQPGVRYDDEL